MTEAIERWLAGLRTPGRPDEHDLKRRLAAAGLAVPDGVRLEPEATLPEIRFPGPWAAKVCDPDVLHKTDRGGVILGLDAATLPEATARLRERFPGSPVLVERQLRFDGPEWIVGALRDPVFGTAVMVGAGGILAELYADVGFRLAPLPAAEARRMVQELTIAPVFSGFRGLRLDLDGLAELIRTVGDIAVSLEDLPGELDLNPVVSANGVWTVLDAKWAGRGPKTR